MRIRPQKSEILVFALRLCQRGVVLAQQIHFGNIYWGESGVCAQAARVPPRSIGYDGVR